MNRGPVHEISETKNGIESNALIFYGYIGFRERKVLVMVDSKIWLGPALCGNEGRELTL